MQNNFDYFIEKIPVNIHNHTKSIITTNIAIFVRKNSLQTERWLWKSITL